MKKTLKVIAAAALACAVATGAAGCGNDSQASATPAPTETQAPMIVLTPAPTPISTPSASEASSEPTSSEESSSSSPSSSSSSSGVLKIQMQGEDVTELQERLQALGYLNKVTGYFGTDTERAVKEFQTRNNLTADGKVGPATMEALMSESAREAN